MKNIPKITFKDNVGAKDIELIRLQELLALVAQNPNHDPSQPHRIDFFALLIVTSGSGTHQVDFNSYDITVGDVIKIAKGQVQAFQENFEYDGFLIVFTEDFLIKQFSHSALDLVYHLYNYHLLGTPIQKSPHTLSFLKELQKELSVQNEYAQQEIIAKVLELFLLRLEQQAKKKSPAAVNANYLTVFMKYKNLVEKNYAMTRNVKSYAEELGISTKHLNDIVHKVTLNTAKQFIDGYVILEIKRILFANDLSLKEVAYKTGFDEVTNFTKFFKKHNGCTPKQFILQI